MQRSIFKPDHHDRLALSRGWEVLCILVGQVAVLAAGLAATGDKAGVNAARALLRTGESLARRLLAARALMAPLPRITPLTHKAREALNQMVARRRLDPRDIRYKPPAPRQHRLVLAEPLARFAPEPGEQASRKSWLAPAVRVEHYGILTVTTYSTHGDPAKPPLLIEGAHAPDCQQPPSAADSRQLAHRIAALKDVIDRPQPNVRRMARWIARQRSIDHGRSCPMRPGRAPGQIKDRRRRSQAHNWLGEVDLVARRAAFARAPPDHLLHAAPPSG